MLVQINAEWQSLNVLTGLPVGTAMMVQSQSPSRCYVKQQDTPPASGSIDAAIVEYLTFWQATGGSRETWIRCDASAGQIFIEVL